MKERGLLLTISITLVITLFGTVSKIPTSFAKKTMPVSEIIETIKDMLDDEDELGARILIRKVYKLKKIKKSQWLTIRRLLHKHPRIGFDFIFGWDRHPMWDLSTNQLAKILEKQLKTADKKMSKKKFNEAFSLYQNIAKKVHPDTKSRQRNFLFYQSLLHKMGRALFGAQRYGDALTVYNWINPRYYQYRQTMFEKMWVGFNMGRYDIALGAIASQRSTYFAKYLQPETYLVQIYSLMRLCRYGEAKAVKAHVERFINDLNTGYFDHETWAKFDLENMPIKRLITRANWPDSDYLSRKNRIDEIKRVSEKLETKYIKDGKRLIRTLKQILSYSTLALGEKPKVFPKLERLSPKKFMTNLDELWPQDDGEDWLDELGQHIFIGESQCEQM